MDFSVIFLDIPASSIYRLIEHSVEALSQKVVRLRVLGDETTAREEKSKADVFPNKTSVQCAFEY